MIVAENSELDLLEDGLRKTMLAKSGPELDAALTQLGWAEMEELINMGAEVSIQNRFHGRLGYVHDPEGEITSMTFGVGLDLDVSSFRFLGEGEKMVPTVVT